MNLAGYVATQREWSERTFGPGSRHEGVVDHIKKELREIEQKPEDVMEWVDVTILALDGAWRTGASPDHIATFFEWLFNCVNPDDPQRPEAGIEAIEDMLNGLELARGKEALWVMIAAIASLVGTELAGSREAFDEALQRKAEKNHARRWPDWRTSDPTKAIEHDRQWEPGL
jgi:hypothetical protein